MLIVGLFWLLSIMVSVVISMYLCDKIEKSKVARWVQRVN